MNSILVSTSSSHDSEPFWEKDFSEISSLDLFYSAKEAVLAYAGTYGILNRRILAPEVTNTLESFAEHKASAAEIEFISSIIERDGRLILNAANVVTESDSRLVSMLRSLDPIGFELLEISDSIDLKKLKASYKRGARKYHPDLGGSKTDMQALNLAYSLFFEAINNYEFANATDFVCAAPSSLTDWLFAIHLTLACIYGDSFSVDHAQNHLQRAYEYMRLSDNPFLGQFIGYFTHAGLDRTCRALARFGMASELRLAARLTSEFFDRHLRDWGPTNEDSYKPSRDEFPSQEDFLMELGTNFTLGSAEQARNAFRFGKIDRRRCDEALRRADKQNAKRLENIKLVNEFANSIGFVPILSGSADDRTIRKARVIRPPQYGEDRFAFLSDVQKWEYSSLFSRGEGAEVYEKYHVVRANELLISIIKNYEYLDIEKLKEEVNFFRQNLRREFPTYELLSEVIDHISGLSDEARREKVALLSEMDDTEKPKANSLLIFVGSRFAGRTEPVIHKKRIQLTNDYVEFLKQDVETIRLFRASGCDSSYQIVLKRDRESLYKLDKTGIGAARKAVWLSSRTSPPEIIIASCEPYIKALIDLGKTFHPKNTGELQIGYEINRLTTAYGKLRKWHQVFFWCKLFFDLPDAYRGRSTGAELETLTKRLDRAKHMLSHQNDSGKVRKRRPSPGEAD